MLDLTYEELNEHLSDLYREYLGLQEREIKLLAEGLRALENDQLERLYHITEEIISNKVQQAQLKEYLHAHYKLVATLH